MQLKGKTLVLCGFEGFLVSLNIAYRLLLLIFSANAVASSSIFSMRRA
jgi:hypothetical protein